MSTPKRPNFFQRLLKTLLGISSNVWDVAEPILKSSIGGFLAVAVPVATELVIKTIASGGKLDDKTRDQVADQLKEELIARGVNAGLQVTTGLAKYAIDTAYHSARVEGKI